MKKSFIMVFEIRGNGINFKLLITFCPLFLLCFLPLWFICLYFSFTYRLALGCFLEWFHWGSCQPLLMTTCECLRRWMGIWWDRGKEGFFSGEGGILSRIVGDQTAPVSHPPMLCGYSQSLKVTQNQEMIMQWPVLSLSTQQHDVSE